MANILPRDLPAVGGGVVDPNAAIIIDDGVGVWKATPAQLVDAARPSNAQADTATGLAATAVGGTFWVDQGNGTGKTYRHDAGPVATLIGTFIIDVTASGAAGLVGWIQSFVSAATGLARSVGDKLSDHLDIRDFAGADPTGATDSTAAFQAAIVEAHTSGRPLRLSRGRWKVSDSLFPAATYIEKLTIFGDGRKATIIDNDAVGVPLFNCGNSYNLVLRDFGIEGNGLTGATGNGHAIAGTDPALESGTYLPGFLSVQRVDITGHRGNDVNYAAAAMPACAIYLANALGAVFDHVFTMDNSFGAYAYKSYQPTFRDCIWNGNHLSGLVADQCENLRLVRPDMVGGNDMDSGGTVHVGAGGALTGGYDRRAGCVVDYVSEGSEYHGGKYKNFQYSGLSLWSPGKPLVSAAWIRLDDIDGAVGIYNANGAIILDNKFAYSGAAATANRKAILHKLQDGHNSAGVCSHNAFRFGGSGKFGELITYDASLISRISGVCEGNFAGDVRAQSGASTLDSFIKVIGGVRNLVLTGNHLDAGSGMTVAAVYHLSGITAMSDQGLTFDANSSWDFLGAGVITAVKVGTPVITGLQANGKYEVAALQVNGVQVIGAQGAAVADAVAAVAAPTQAEFNALVTQFNLLAARARAHGLIAT